MHTRYEKPGKTSFNILAYFEINYDIKSIIRLQILQYLVDIFTHNILFFTDGFR